MTSRKKSTSSNFVRINAHMATLAEKNREREEYFKWPSRCHYVQKNPPPSAMDALKRLFFLLLLLPFGDSQWSGKFFFLSWQIPSCCIRGKMERYLRLVSIPLPKWRVAQQCCWQDADLRNMSNTFLRDEKMLLKILKRWEAVSGWNKAYNTGWKDRKLT